MIKQTDSNLPALPKLIKLSKNDESKAPKDYDPTNYIHKNSWLFFSGGNHQGKSHTNDPFYKLWLLSLLLFHASELWHSGQRSQ